MAQDNSDFVWNRTSYPYGSRPRNSMIKARHAREGYRPKYQAAAYVADYQNAHGVPPPETTYSNASNMLSETVASTFNSVMTESGVEIESIATYEQCVKGIQTLCSHKTNVVALDCEWKPNFVKGQGQNKVSILQISNHKLCLIIYLQRLVESKHGIPQLLLQFLQNKQIIKVGVGIGCDALKLEQDYGIEVCSCYDLSELISKKCKFNKFLEEKIAKLKSDKGLIKNEMKLTRVSCGTLDGVVYLLTNGVNIGKTKSSTMSNWARYPLSLRQIQYAARDVVYPFYAFIQILFNMSNETVDYKPINFDNILSIKSQTTKVMEDAIVHEILSMKLASMIRDSTDIVDPQIKIKERRKQKKAKKKNKAKIKAKAQGKWQKVASTPDKQ